MRQLAAGQQPAGACSPLVQSPLRWPTPGITCRPALPATDVPGGGLPMSAASAHLPCSAHRCCAALVACAAAVAPLGPCEPEALLAFVEALPRQLSQQGGALHGPVAGGDELALPWCCSTGLAVLALEGAHQRICTLAGVQRCSWQPSLDHAGPRSCQPGITSMAAPLKGLCMRRLAAASLGQPRAGRPAGLAAARLAALPRLQQRPGPGAPRDGRRAGRVAGSCPQVSTLAYADLEPGAVSLPAPGRLCVGIARCPGDHGSAGAAQVMLYGCHQQPGSATSSNLLASAAARSAHGHVPTRSGMQAGPDGAVCVHCGQGCLFRAAG